MGRFRPELLATSADWRRESDTLFVLGCGPSVNELGEREWEHVRAHDSVGLNFWALHSFVPSFYFHEPREELFDFFRGLLESKAEAYADTPVFINAAHLVDFFDPEAGALPLNGKVYLPTVMYFTSYKLANAIARIKRFRIRLGADLFSSILHWTGSLSLPVSLGIALGYRRIVLVGVDLNGEGYFFDDHEDDMTRRFLELQRGIRGVEKASSKDRSVHFTADPGRKYPMPEVLERIRKTWDPAGKVEFFVSSPRSNLSRTYPVYDFQGG